MLKHPRVIGSNPVLSMIAISSGNDDSVKVIEDGILQIGHYSGDMILFGKNDFDRSYPEVPDCPSSCGVCDSPDQFLKMFREALQADPRHLTVTFTHVRKDHENRGQGGGWRWHKWGAYIGTGTPECEYLDDEDEFEGGIFVFHIYDVTGLVGPVDQDRWDKI